MEKKNYPLILVFYLDREMMQNRSIIQPFADSVNKILEQKLANAVAFFIPAAEGTPERIECINPTVVAEADMSKINKMVEDIKTSFSIDDKITLDEKTCKCESGDKCDCGNN